MAISVTKFLVSNDMSQIELDVAVNTGETVSTLSFWTEDTYKDPVAVVDLSSLIVGTGNTESLVITPEQAGLSKFDGMYFMQIESSDDEAVVVSTFNLLQYYIPLAKLLANVDLSCLNCNVNFQNALLFDLYLEGTKQALLLGRFRDAIDNLAKLNIVSEKSDCDECNNIEPLVSTAGNVVSVGVIDCLLTEV